MRVGTNMTVLIDTVDEKGAVGRSSADAPEIDGCVYVASSKPLKPGQLVSVTITSADEYDLHGDAVH